MHDPRISSSNEAAEACDEGCLDAGAMFTRMWADFAGKMAMSGLSFAPDATAPEAARQIRNSIFEAMTHYCDEYMRSPQFLEAMKQSLDATMLARQQFNAFLTRMHHEMQGTAREDIDALMLTIRHVETRVLDRMDELTVRLDELTRRLDQGNGETKTASPREAPGSAPAPAEDETPSQHAKKRPR